ncbi:uncharacterized protein LOC131623765 [Vicia villosa]|uniref:uncharacterized protein LOC131623765 n=1 Tax=Vicia villosa TaxID=3911 RepID=UPI00273AA9B4|nr:uncharacterized protein LOC131623765 [Vicia villosa]
MKFYLTLKKLINVLIEDIPVDPSGSTEQTNNKQFMDLDGIVHSNELDSTTVQTKANNLLPRKEISLWKEKDYFFKYHILNGLIDDLYDYYSNNETAKQVSEALNKKYDIEKDGLTNHVVSHYLEYQNVDESFVEAQCHELQKIAHEIIIEACPYPFGKPLKNQNCNVVSQIKNENPLRAPIAPIARHHPPPQRNNDPIFTCFTYGKSDYKAKICKSRRKPVVGSSAQVNLTNEQFIYTITKINMVGRFDGWWIDTGICRHVSYDRAIFKTYMNAENKKVLLGDAHTTNDAVIGDVENCKFSIEQMNQTASPETNLIIKKVPYELKVKYENGINKLVLNLHIPQLVKFEPDISIVYNFYH